MLSCKGFVRPRRSGRCLSEPYWACTEDNILYIIYQVRPIVKPCNCYYTNRTLNFPFRSSRIAKSGGFTPEIC